MPGQKAGVNWEGATIGGTCPHACGGIIIAVNEGWL